MGLLQTRFLHNNADPQPRTPRREVVVEPNGYVAPNICESILKMPHKKKAGKRKKVYRRHGKRYYRTKSGFVKLKGGKKPPRRR
tara:strand:- start:24 stop:275 length:252 start_codon:yes stop_codon:yes gene_type:complete